MDLTGHIWGYYICVYTNACMHALKIYGKRQKNSKEFREGYMEDLEGGKEREKCCNQITISKMNSKNRINKRIHKAKSFLPQAFAVSIMSPG